MRGETVQISVRVPVEHVRILNEIAAREDRSMSAELRRIIRWRVENSITVGLLSKGESE